MPHKVLLAGLGVLGGADLVEEEGPLPGDLPPDVVPAAAAAVPGHHLGAQQHRALGGSLVTVSRSRATHLAGSVK